jgi:arylsulfatase A-like enzyme
VRFTFDDDAAGTFLPDTVPPPNHVRCVREERLKYAAYVDPAGRASAQHELYDLDRDPLELSNLVDRDSGEARDRSYAAALERMRARVAAVPRIDRVGVP